MMNQGNQQVQEQQHIRFCSLSNINKSQLVATAHT